MLARLCLNTVLVCVLSMAISIVPLPMATGVSIVHAQDDRPQTLMELFQRNRQRQAAPRRSTTVRRAPAQRRATTSRPRQQRQRSTPRRAQQRGLTSAPAPPVQAVEKNENARQVLVVGDFTADGTAQGLQTAFADAANIVIQSRTNGSSGLVRDDYFNWTAEIPAILDAVNPDLVVVQLGSNDRQAMRVDGASYDVRSDVWTQEYQRRIDALLDVIATRNVALVWVGSPPFRFRSMSADILAFNEMYQSAVETRQGYFVDIWDGFVDEDGRFVASGPDIKGQTVRLRASDGINFTAAGKRKMAFYAERQIRLLIGDDASPVLTSLAPDGQPMMRLPPLKTETELERTNPIAFSDPDLDGGSALLGDMASVPATPLNPDNPLAVKSLRQQLIEDGATPPPQPGRVGDFRWQSPVTTSDSSVPPLTSDIVTQDE